MTGSDDGNRGEGAPAQGGPTSCPRRRAWPRRDLPRTTARSTPSATALVDAEGGREWTYADLDDLVGAVAARLDAGLPDAGGRIGLLCSTRVETAVVLHAAMRTCTPAVPLEPGLPAGDVADRLARAEVGLLVCERDTESTALEAATCPVSSVDPPAAELVDSLDPLRSEPTTAGEAARAAYEPAPLSRSDEALVAFTSGTTGDPAGVRLTVGNLVASATASAFRLGTLPADRWLAPLPMAHLGGLSPVFRTALYGTTLVVQQGFDARGTAAVLAEHGATGASLVPTQLKRMLDRGWEPPSSLRCVLLGGAPAGRDLLVEALERDVPVFTTYGATEAASQIATARPPAVRERPEAVGHPLQFTEVTVVDDGVPVPAGQRGALVVDGPTVTPGYLDEADTRAAFGEYGLHTGDLGYREADGTLVVLGRLDDTILTGGETVHPASVVDVLRDYPAVSDAAVVGLPDEEWGERVAALVVAEDVGAEAIREVCRDRLPPYAVPKEVVVVDSSLPRTASGTVDREAVRERLATE
ncbi:MAG: AMP-binding protein [Haloarculaceae archaeon]